MKGDRENEKGRDAEQLEVRGGHQGERSATHALQQVGRGRMRGGNCAWHEQKSTMKWRGVNLHKGTEDNGIWNGRSVENYSRTWKREERYLWPGVFGSERDYACG